jgi:hypothetical protein
MNCGMANTAAVLVDRVVRAVPVRQRVLSLSFKLRRLAAFRVDVARALDRTFIEVVALEETRAAITAGRQRRLSARTTPLEVQMPRSAGAKEGSTRRMSF